MPAHIFQLKKHVKHSIRPIHEQVTFSELMIRIINVYDKVKHLNPPKEKLITAAINEFHMGNCRVTAHKGRPLTSEEIERRLTDYNNGLDDKELSQLWKISVAGVTSWRLDQKLGVNKRKRG